MSQSLERQKELRLAMALARSKKQQSKPTIDSPFAIYNQRSGVIVCKLCGKSIKDPILWKAHEQSKPHKRNLISHVPSKKRTRDKKEIVHEEGHEQSSPLAASLTFIPSRKEAVDTTSERSITKEPQNQSLLPSHSSGNPQLPSHFFDNKTQEAISFHKETPEELQNKLLEQELEAFQETITIEIGSIETKEPVETTDERHIVPLLGKRKNLLEKIHKLREKTRALREKQATTQKLIDSQPKKEEENKESVHLEDIYDWRKKKCG